MPLKRAVTEFGKTYKDRFALRTYPGTSVPIFIFILGWSRTKPRVTLPAHTMLGVAGGEGRGHCRGDSICSAITRTHECKSNPSKTYFSRTIKNSKLSDGLIISQFVPKTGIVV